MLSYLDQKNKELVNTRKRVENSRERANSFIRDGEGGFPSYWILDSSRKKTQPTSCSTLDSYLARFSRLPSSEITSLGGKRCRIFIRFGRRRASISFRPRLLLEFHRNVYVNYFLRFIGRGITSSPGKKHAFKSKACALGKNAKKTC